MFVHALCFILFMFFIVFYYNNLKDSLVTWTETLLLTTLLLSIMLFLRTLLLSSLMSLILLLLPLCHYLSHSLIFQRLRLLLEKTSKGGKKESLMSLICIELLGFLLIPRTMTMPKHGHIRIRFIDTLF